MRIASNLMMAGVPPESNWTLNNLTYQSSKTLTSASYSYNGITFKPDGTQMFLSYLNGSTNVIIETWNLSTAWDTSTATSSSTTNLYSDVPYNSQRVNIDNSGTVLTMTSADANDRIYGGTLSTAYSPSSYSPSWNLDISTYSPIPFCNRWGDSGYKLYISGYNPSFTFVFLQYTVSSPYTINSGVTYNHSTNLGMNNNTGFSISPDGKTIIACDTGNSPSYIFSTKLNTAWDLSSVNYSSRVSVNVASNNTNEKQGLFVNELGDNLYVIRSDGFSVSEVHHYTLV